MKLICSDKPFNKNMYDEILQQFEIPKSVGMYMALQRSTDKVTTFFWFLKRCPAILKNNRAYREVDKM